MFDGLMKKIEYAKNCLLPNRALYEVHGGIKMAYELKAITSDEFLKLEHECVANGINNSKYFDR